LLPIKKDSLLDPLEVYQATVSNNKKYPITKAKSTAGDIDEFIFLGLH